MANILKRKKIEKKTLENNRFVKNWRIYERTNSIDKKERKERKLHRKRYKIINFKKNLNKLH